MQRLKMLYGRSSHSQTHLFKGLQIESLEKLLALMGFKFMTSVIGVVVTNWEMGDGHDHHTLKM